MEDRINSLQARLDSLSSRMKALEEQPHHAVARVQNATDCAGIATAIFKKTPADYYDKSLESRANLLGCHPRHLCKTIVFENVSCEHSSCKDITDSKYYCVIVQYCARIQAEKLRDFVYRLKPEDKRIPKNKFVLRLADEAVSQALTGFVHNAISPLGMLTPIPLIVCSSAASVRPSFLWLGGGAVNVKLCIPTADLVRITGALVADVSEEREPGNVENVDEDQ